MLPRWFSYKGFWRDVRPGLTLEVGNGQQCTFCTVVAHNRGRMVVKPDGSVPATGDVTIRMPIDGALLRATARVTEIMEGSVPAFVLERFEHVERCERRRFARLLDPVAVRVNGDGVNDRTLAALNLSGRGMLLGWPDKPNVVLGERLQLTVFLEGMHDMAAVGEVVRVDDHRAAMRFVDISQYDQDQIVGYVFRRECERRGSRDVAG